jgi:hypothetical protein
MGPANAVIGNVMASRLAAIRFLVMARPHFSRRVCPAVDVYILETLTILASFFNKNAENARFIADRAGEYHVLGNRSATAQNTAPQAGLSWCKYLAG